MTHNHKDDSDDRKSNVKRFDRRRLLSEQRYRRIVVTRVATQSTTASSHGERPRSAHSGLLCHLSKRCTSRVLPSRQRGNQNILSSTPVGCALLTSTPHGSTCAIEWPDRNAAHRSCCCEGEGVDLSTRPRAEGCGLGQASRVGVGEVTQYKVKQTQLFENRGACTDPHPGTNNWQGGSACHARSIYLFASAGH